MTLLTARGLSVIPPGSRRPVVDDFTLSVSAGEWVGVTGGNGGGKTSLLLGLAGLWPITGELRLHGLPFPPAEERARSGVAIVLQDPSTQILQPTVRDELAFGLRNQGVATGEVEARLAAGARELGLEPMLDHDPATLSAGWQQTVLLAAALVTEPQLLLADEPTAHMDPEARRRAIDAIGLRRSQGMGALWVTQIPDELAAADRILEVGPKVRGPQVAMSATSSGPESVRIRVRPPTTAEGSGPRVSVDRTVEISVPSRGITAVVGRNGIGKSAILGAIAGHTPIDQVEAVWSVPTDPSPITTLQYPELQIFEERPEAEVVYAAVARGVAPRDALDMAWQHLEALGMERQALTSRRTWTLSTGEKRILELVSALIAPACLYVLDEPSAGLDPARKAMLARLIVEHAASSPILVASQDVDWLRALGAFIFNLDTGKVGPPEHGLT